MKVGCVVVYGNKDIFDSFAELRKNGLDIRSDIFTVEEASDEILKLIERGEKND